MALPDISKLNYDELGKLAKKALALQQRKKNDEQAALRAQFVALAKAKGLTLDEVLSAKSKRGKVAPKYANPNNREQKWTGRGRKPAWVVKALDKGAHMDSLKIATTT